MVIIHLIEQVSRGTRSGMSPISQSFFTTYHHISRQHTNLYFAELDYKYNHRKDGDAFWVVYEGGVCLAIKMCA